MKPLSLSMWAFGPYKDHLQLDFTQLRQHKLFLITGPTGSGKTTIFDGISFALFGESSTDLRESGTLRSHFAEEDVLTKVQYTFLLKGSKYMVEREPKQLRPKARTEGYTEHKPTAVLHIYDESHEIVSEIVSGVSNVNQKIEEILGITSRQFRQIMMIPQGEFRKLLMAESQERELVLQQLFNTEFFHQFQNKMIEKSKNLSVGIKNQQLTLHTHLGNIVFEEEENQQLLDGEERSLQLIKEAWMEEKKKVTVTMGENSNRQNELMNQLKELEEEAAEKRKVNETIMTISQLKEKIHQEEAKRQSIDDTSKKIVACEKAIRIEVDLISKNQAKHEYERVLKEYESEKMTLSHIKITYNDCEKKWNEVTSKAFDEKLETCMTAIDDITKWLKDLDVVTQLEIQADSTQRENKAIEEKLDKEKTQRLKTLKEIEQLEEENQTMLVLQRRKSEDDQRAITYRNYYEELMRIAKDWLEKEKIGREVIKLQSQVKNSFNVMNLERERYEQIKLMFFHEQAAILAKSLALNMPCPVCGSLDHPMPTEFSGDHVSKEDVEEREIIYETHRQDHNMLATRLEVMERDLARIHTTLDAFKERFAKIDQIVREDDTLCSYNQETTGDLLRILDRWIKEHEEKWEKLNPEKTIEALDHQITKHKVSVTSMDQCIEEIQSQLKTQTAMLDRLLGQVEMCLKQLPKECPERTALVHDLQKKQEEKENMVHSRELAIKKYEDQKQALIKSQTRLEGLLLQMTVTTDKVTTATQKLEESMQASGIGSESELNNLLAYKLDLDKDKERVKNYEENLLVLNHRIRDLEETIHHKAVIDLTELQELINHTKMKLEEMKEAYILLREKVQANDKIIEMCKEIYENVSEQLENYRKVGHISQLLSGRNRQNISLERFVLAAFLDEIVKAANARLKDMSTGRYELRRTEELARANRQSGLDLEVIDGYTGKARSVKTLSGGESFMASLSMALGLSDVVEQYSGGVHLDTMFIDEGFGTLDQEALDSAIRCLVDLQKSGRLVGIISHVEELKERIEAKLIVVGDRDGSRAQFVI